MTNKFWFGVIALVTVLVLVGCNGGQASPTAQGASAYTSQVLITSYQGALSAADQLMMGTLRLEDTEQAVTTEQAKALLPLWQALQSSALKAEVERKAAYAQIEAAMTPAQLQAIAAMQLTQDDLQDAPPGGGQFGNPGGGQRPTGQPGGSPGEFGGGQPGAMSDEQRQAFRATAQAGGMPGGSRGAGGARATGGGSGQNSFMLNMLIRLLRQRAGLEPAPDRSATRAPALTPNP